jgi:hypothetical protein
MVKLAGFAPVVTGALGRPESVGFTLVRAIRPEKLISTGGRGPGGADMVDGDATNLCLGLICSDQLKDAATVIKRYRAMRYSANATPMCPEPLRWIPQSSQRLDLGGLMDGLIGMAREGTLQVLLRQLAAEQLPAGVPDLETRIDKAIDLGMVSLKLEFQRPRPAGRIAFGVQRHSLLNIDFGLLSTWESEEELNSLQTGDLVETATITHRTIFALGEALRQ